MQDTELSGKFLKLLFPEFDVLSIKCLNSQEPIWSSYDAKGVRLDVRIGDAVGKIYDLEMQVAINSNLPRRTRYYQSALDQQLIEKGAEYYSLRDCYLIFICLVDMFGRDRSIYTFRNMCVEDRDIFLDDGATKIFLNASGTVGEVGKGMQNFLDYVATGKVTDDYTKELNDSVDRARIKRAWKEEFMMMSVREMDAREEGREEGSIQAMLKFASFKLKQGDSENSTINDLVSIFRIDETAARSIIQRTEIEL